MKNICEKYLCTGCGACLNKCPQNAISMKENEEGFLYPEIDSEKCINCGLCKKVCPINTYENKNYDLSDKYLVMASDEIRKTSSSGGVFRVLANYVLKNNGYVCGAVFNENMVVEHILSNKTEDILRMSDSKYVQSNLKNCFKEIKEKLDNNIQVLFSGCPCQVAGLKNYLSKDYENLITVDLICHGVPSPLVLKKYFEEEYPNEKVLDMKFRSKKNGWNHDWNTTIKTIKNEYSHIGIEDLYYNVFGSDISNRISCYHCHFTTTKRAGDFTMCDAWGYEKKFNDNKGSSIIFLNNSKAKSIFKIIKNEFKKIKRINRNYTQPQMCYSIAPNPARKIFFKNIKEKSLKEILKLTNNHSKNVGILNFAFNNENFGAVLTGYALTKTCNDLGYNAQNINYKLLFASCESHQPNKLFDNFKEKYLPSTKLILSESDFEELNYNFDIFISGSDQVFGKHLIKNDHYNHYFLNFAKPDKKLIACAASFGGFVSDETYGNKTSLMLKYLKNFNSISFREESSVKYFENKNIHSTWILDPVFFLSKEQWSELANTNPIEKKEYDVFSYFVEEDDLKKYINEINKFNHFDKFKTYKMANSENSCLEDWLYQIKNSKLVITHSFHATCFAILFNKPFIALSYGKSARIETLLNKFKINKNRIYDITKGNDFSFLNEEIDYNIVNQKINEYRKMSIDWLYEALNKPVENIEEKVKTKKEISELVYTDAKKNIGKAFKNYLLFKTKYIITQRKDKKERYKWKDTQYTAKYKIYKEIIKNKDK